MTATFSLFEIRTAFGPLKFVHEICNFCEVFQFQEQWVWKPSKALFFLEIPKRMYFQSLKSLQIKKQETEITEIYCIIVGPADSWGSLKGHLNQYCMVFIEFTSLLWCKILPAVFSIITLVDSTFKVCLKAK